MGVITNFPDGISSFGMPVIGGNGQIPATTGSYFFVCSGGGAGGIGAGTFDQPYATLAQAVSAATAAKMDVIVALPGHAEAIASSSGLLVTKSGLQFVGIGVGALRPTLNFTTANTSTIVVSAANVSFSNFLFTAAFLSIAAAITLTTAANFSATGCEFRDLATATDFLNCVKSTGAANTIDGINLSGNIWTSLGTTSVNTFLLSANAIDRAILQWNYINQVTTVDAAALLVVTTGVLTNFNAGYNKVYRANTTTANGSLINVGGTTSTGFVYNNYVQTLTTSSDKLFTTTVGLSAFNNYVTGVVGASGFLIPAVDS